MLSCYNCTGIAAFWKMAADLGYHSLWFETLEIMGPIGKPFMDFDILHNYSNYNLEGQSLLTLCGGRYLLASICYHGYPPWILKSITLIISLWLLRWSRFDLWNNTYKELTTWSRLNLNINWFVYDHHIKKNKCKAWITYTI